MRKMIVLPLVFAFLFALGGTVARAQESEEDEKKTDTTVRTVDKEADTPEGQKAVVERLKSDFNVDDARIDSLRQKKLGYGEIAIVLALAQQMPGGITDANVQKVTDLRQGDDHKMGWGNVAKELGTKLGPAVSHAEKFSAEVKTEKTKPERAARPERSERPDKPGRPEKTK